MQANTSNKIDNTTPCRKLQTRNSASINKTLKPSVHAIFSILVFTLLFLGNAVVTAACDGNHCCFNSDCGDNYCEGGHGYFCKCKEEKYFFFTAYKYNTGECRSRRANGQEAYQGDYESCSHRNGICGICGPKVNVGQSCSANSDCYSGWCEGQITIGCQGTCMDIVPPTQMPTMAAEQEPIRSKLGSPYSKKFMLINPETGKVLDVSDRKCHNGNNINLWRRNDTPAQIFHYHYESKAIVNVLCDKALDLSGNRCDNGTNLQLWSRHGGMNQQFMFYTDRTIRSAQCNRVIDVAGYNMDNGANLYVWDKHGGWNQKWKVQYV